MSPEEHLESKCWDRLLDPREHQTPDQADERESRLRESVVIDSLSFKRSSTKSFDLRKISSAVKLLV